MRLFPHLAFKSVEDAITVIEIMALSELQGQYKINHSPRKTFIIKLNTNDAILAQNKLLTQIVDELTKKLPKLPRQLKGMKEVP